MTEPRVVVCRNEVDPAHAYHCDALAASLPDAVELDYAAGDRPDLDDADAVVLTGSTAGVYEADAYPWMHSQMALVETLVDREIPTLAVCFGHQLANAALGGTVEAKETTARLVDVEFADDPLFAGVEPVVPAVHGDVVVEPAPAMDVVATTDYYDAFATRHRDAPLWSVQFHPEFTAAHRDRLDADYGWSDGDHSFADVNAGRVYANFTRIVADGDY
ncbi:type 1 glutamine amidotransferase [Halorubellus sp. JP-L1]|uniref:type 1 glutamine amidotransferase n=1 Tax=Halorubellus sp. JP-L1 TaxID=2715753 RepID=UPI00140B4967|nr:type 1 glutamine amidotransferase [Halorubellus sp. JP-L1]NHN43071.1 type 1 glutamine amidotransferase [Halorubellus sp. JP-L1]